MDIINRVNDLFKQYKVDLEANHKVQMAEAALEDGTTILTDGESFEVGAAVYVLSPEGNQIPLPDGSYTLGDGTTLVVVEGVITEVGTAEAPAEEAPAETAEMSNYMTRKQVEDLIVKSLAGVVKENMSQVSKLRAEFSAQKAVTAKLSKTAPLSHSREVEKQPVDLKGLKGIALVQALQDQLK